MTTHTVGISMNGFRENLSTDIKELRSLIDNVINDNYFDRDELAEAMNAVICASNGLNCVSMEGDDTFTDISHIELSIIEVEN